MKIGGYRNCCIHKEVLHINFIANIAIKRVFFCLFPSADIFCDRTNHACISIAQQSPDNI